LTTQLSLSEWERATEPPSVVARTAWAVTSVLTPSRTFA
jgi:hypothetical protein